MSISREDSVQTISHERSHAEYGKGGTGTVSNEVVLSSPAWDKRRALTTDLMERICNPSNLNQAFKKVKSNGGAAGVDGMTVDQLFDWIKANKEAIISSLLDGSYKPQPVRSVEIPKPSGGIRRLGIPTCFDRFIQQAILQVLQPIFDPTFSDSSFGFRPGRSAHDAVKKASHYVNSGKQFVVDVDLEKFFDRVNHDILMSRLARSVGDKRLLKIIRRFLTAGHMKDGVVIQRGEGTPQGGPLSPLLSNIILDELDKEIERRGHSFCRYADDCNIYVSSLASAERVLQSITRWLEKTLHLKVNITKSAAAPVEERKFLGYRILSDGRLSVAKESLARFRKKLRDLTKRRTPRSVEKVAIDLTPFLRGWLNYFRLSQSRTLFYELDGWVRRRLRCIQLQQCKRFKTQVRFLVSKGISEINAKRHASSGKGKWRLSQTPVINKAMNNKWFELIGLFSLEKSYLLLKSNGTA